MSRVLRLSPIVRSVDTGAGRFTATVLTLLVSAMALSFDATATAADDTPPPGVQPADADAPLPPHVARVREEFAGLYEQVEQLAEDGVDVEAIRRMIDVVRKKLEGLPPPGPSLELIEKERTLLVEAIRKELRRQLGDDARFAHPDARGVPDGKLEPQVVKVFYATDREPIAGDGRRPGIGYFTVPIVTGVAALLCLTLAFVWRWRVLFGLLAVAMLAVTLWQAQSAYVKYDQRNRMAETGSRVYGNDRNLLEPDEPLEVGVCEVSIPPDHRVGKVESPSVFRLEFTEDASKHVVLRSIVRKERDAYFEELSDTIGRSKNKETFVFIHGYNVGFDDAVKRTAQIAHDLRFDGAPICYSWPSHAGLAGYKLDETNVTWSVVHLEAFLNDIRQKTGAKNIHLVAHSMGNRALTQALDRIALQHREDGPIFGQVIMAAPDVDAGEFRDRYAPSITRIARQVTLYASTNDSALMASTKVHGHTRLGLSGEHVVTIPGVDTIDVSPIDTSLIGHSYYGDHPQLIEDMRALVEIGKPAAERAWLQKIARSPTLAYWVFQLTGDGDQNGDE